MAIRIGELSERTAVSRRSLRYYEQQGLLTSTRSAGGQREYADDAVERVIEIQELFAAGLCSSKMAALFRYLERDREDLAGTMQVELCRERQRLDEMMRDLSRAQGVLDEVWARYARPTGSSS